MFGLWPTSRLRFYYVAPVDEGSDTNLDDGPTASEEPQADSQEVSFGVDLNQATDRLTDITKRRSSPPISTKDSPPTQVARYGDKQGITHSDSGIKTFHPKQAGVTTEGKALAQKTAQAGGRALAKTAATATAEGAAVATEAATGPVGWAILAVDIARQVVQSGLFWKILMWIGVVLVAIGVFIHLLAAGTRQQVQTNGPQPGGATAVQPESAKSYNAAVAANQIGVFMPASLASITQFSKGVHQLLSAPPSGAHVAEAEAALQQIDQIKAETEGNTYRSDQKIEGELATRLKTAVQNLYNALYPGRKPLRDKVWNLAFPSQPGQSARIHLESGGGCSPKQDLQGLGLSENLLRVIVAASEQSPITIKCLVTGHRKFVGYPPDSGYPRCGDLRNNEQAHVPISVSQSYHCTGRAIDIGANSSVQRYLELHRTELHIRYMQLEMHPLHLHIEVTS